jgi:hypothetical protein
MHRAWHLLRPVEMCVSCRIFCRIGKLHRIRLDIPRVPSISSLALSDLYLRSFRCYLCIFLLSFHITLFSIWRQPMCFCFVLAIEFGISDLISFIQNLSKFNLPKKRCFCVDKMIWSCSRNFSSPIRRGKGLQGGGVVIVDHWEARL